MTSSSDDGIEILRVSVPYRSFDNSGIEQVAIRTWSSNDLSSSSPTQVAVIARLQDQKRRNGDCSTFGENEDYRVSTRQRIKIADRLAEKGVPLSVSVTARCIAYPKRRKLSDLKLKEFSERNSGTKAESKNTDPDEKSSTPTDICTICTDPLSDTSRAATDQCFHFFCFECIRRWCDIRTSCPVCRKPVRKLIHDIRSAHEFKLLKLKPKDDPPITLALSDYFHDASSAHEHANRIRAANMLSRIVSRIHSTYSARLAEIDQQIEGRPSPCTGRGSNCLSTAASDNLQRERTQMSSAVASLRNSVGAVLAPSGTVLVRNVTASCPEVADESPGVTSIFSDPDTESPGEQTLARQRRARLYHSNIWCIGPDFAALPAGRRRLEPLYYRIVPRHLDRLAPWLERELSAFLITDSALRQVEQLRELIRSVDIESDAVNFRERLTADGIVPSTLSTEQIEHFQHELRMFMASGLRMSIWDTVVRYSDCQTGRPAVLQPATMHDESRLGRSHLYQASPVSSQLSTCGSTFSQDSIRISVASSQESALDPARRLESLRQRLTGLNRAATSLGRTYDYSSTMLSSRSSVAAADEVVSQAVHDSDSNDGLRSGSTSDDSSFSLSDSSDDTDSDADSSSNSYSNGDEIKTVFTAPRNASTEQRISTVCDNDVNVIEYVDSGVETVSSVRSSRVNLNGTIQRRVNSGNLDDDSDIEILSEITRPISRSLNRGTRTSNVSVNAGSSSILNDITPNAVKVNANDSDETDAERRRGFDFHSWGADYYEFDVESQYVHVEHPLTSAALPMGNRYADGKLESLRCCNEEEMLKPNGFEVQLQRVKHSAQSVAAAEENKIELDGTSGGLEPVPDERSNSLFPSTIKNSLISDYSDNLESQRTLTIDYDAFRWTYEDECQALTRS